MGTFSPNHRARRISLFPHSARRRVQSQAVLSFPWGSSSSSAAFIPGCAHGETCARKTDVCPQVGMKHTVAITVNGVKQSAEVEPRLLLVHFLRETLGLTGTNVGCDTSQCGSCTVLIDGQAVKSCTVLAVQADGGEVTTIEGLASNGKLHPVQQAFWDKHGLQCGFCTPGMIMTAYDLIKRNPNPSEAEVRHGIEGTMCRCTGYQNIVAAVREAATRMKG